MGYFDDNPITKSPYISDVDLLWHPDYKKKNIALDFTGAEGGCIKAGSPISAAGAVANDGNAVGVLLHDCYDGFQPYGSVVIDGFVKENVAQEHSGVELSDEAKRSMSKLVFVDASGVVDPPAGGGGGNFIFDNAIFVKENFDESTMDEYPYVSFAGEETQWLFMIICEQFEDGTGELKTDYISIAPRNLIGNYDFTTGHTTDFDGKDYLGVTEIDGGSYDDEIEPGHILFESRTMWFENKNFE